MTSLIELLSEKNMSAHVNFETFKNTVEIGMHFVDNMDSEEIRQHMQDWYVLYKEMRYYDVQEWLNFQFNNDEVTRDTHDFWLDKKGMMILFLQSRIN